MSMGDDGKMLMALPNKPLAAGTYKVKWHATGPDGKPVEGEFSFTAR
jgi:methionine-rich copper-binding protein CopC